MSDLQQIFGAGFDTHSVEPQSDFEVIPPGKYPVLIEKAVVKPTKKGDGHYVEITLSVLDGPCKNRKVWDRINIQNPSDKCVEIGLRQLAALGQAIHLAAIQDTAQLLNQVCIAHVKVKDEQNEVRTYSALEVPGAATSNAPPNPAAPPQYAPLPPQPQYPAQQMPPTVYPPPGQIAQQQYVPPPSPAPGSYPQQSGGAPGKPPWAR